MSVVGTVPWASAVEYSRAETEQEDRQAGRQAGRPVMPRPWAHCRVGLILPRKHLERFS